MQGCDLHCIPVQFIRLASSLGLLFLFAKLLLVLQFEGLNCARIISLGSHKYIISDWETHFMVKGQQGYETCNALVLLYTHRSEAAGLTKYWNSLLKF